MSLKEIIILLVILIPFSAVAQEGTIQKNQPLVVMETTMGKITIEVFDQEAPISAKNFRNYVNQGFYDGLIFHRVIPGFMIQGGGFEPGMKRRTPQKPIPNEATNGLKNKRGSLSMARTRDINSATSQFFINVVDNVSLDNRGTMPHEFGYAVYAKVVEGMSVADNIVKTPTITKMQFRNVPKEDVVIIRAYEAK